MRSISPVARLVTSKKASLRWPAKWPSSPAEMFLGEDGPQNIYGRLISALPSIRPYIDHRARVHNSSSPLEDAVTSLLGQSVWAVMSLTLSAPLDSRCFSS